MRLHRDSEAMNMKQIIEYINEILDDNNKEIKHSEYAKLRFLPSNGIKGLFYFKVSEAIDKKIKVNINVSKSIDNSFICNLNMCMARFKYTILLTVFYLSQLLFFFFLFFS